VERSRDLLASIVESSDYGIIGMELDGTILSWNQGAGQIYGYASEEMQGRPSSVLFTGESASELRQDTETLQRGGISNRRELTGATKDGRAVQVSVNMSPIRNAEGRLIGVAAIVKDITEQKRMQKEFIQAQKMEGIGRLAAGIAHDFNNLLTVVTGYSDMLLSQIKDHDPMHDELSEVKRAGERAATLTRQLLAFSKKQILQPQTLDLNHIVTDMDRMLSRVIGEDIELVTILAPRLGCVYADPGQIEQVIMNLAVNARDAMPHGGKLTVETADVDVDETLARHLGVVPGPRVSLAVTDTGTGMDPQTQARIFEPFFTTKGTAGTGLGLSTVYGIVHQSGGTIRVDSELDHGATFKIYLPRTEAAVQATPPVVASVPKGSETILVVEDEDAVRNLVCSVLKKQGYAPIPARNGGEALLRCEQHSGEISLMITDVVMPSMNGGDLAARMRPLRPDMKVLFISGYAEGGIVRQGILQPNTALLGKPFSPSELARKVRETLDGQGG
jgi:PAS domain S-box-containing protein